MSPISVSGSPPPVPTMSGGGGGPSSAAGLKFNLIFWPILFGAILIALVWRFWTWKAQLGASTGPLSTPKPSTDDVIRMRRIRGAPLLGRPLTSLSIPSPPPPAYIHPPSYNNTPPPYGGGPRTS